MKVIALIIFLSLSAQSISQQNDTYYTFNSEWKPSTVESAKYLIHIHKISDTCWQWDFYNIFGPLLRTEQYRNHDGGGMDGICRHYNETGYLDSTSMYRRGKKNGDFFKIAGDNKRNPKLRYRYKDDSLIEVLDFDKQPRDSLVKYGDERESEYQGGVNQWKNYLKKNLVYPQRAINSNMDGDVRVGFTVDTAGRVQDLFISKSVEYSLDEESLRIIRESGKWNPAFQNWKFVKSYKDQPISFRYK
ncbi:MAG: energy transducer TonB [Chitinophagales bacterium]